VKTDNQIGFYGKLPIIGDFVCRRLPNAFITPWDNWLQTAIATSREQLGANWLDSYLTSPIWRFILSPGVCGNQSVAGIIMPSVDRVGRYFPLTVAVAFESVPHLSFLFTNGNYWFEQLEDAALSGLEGRLNIEEFDKLIESLPLFSMPVGICNNQLQTTASKKVFQIVMNDPGEINNAFVSLNKGLLDSFMPGYSLWTTDGSDCVQPSLLVCEGLPAVADFSGFLTGSLINTSWSTQMDKAENQDKKSREPISDIAQTEPVSLTSILAIDSKPYWQSWSATDTGKRRKHNEDSLLNKPKSALWVVADGMGGHKAGDVASQLIVNSLDELLPIEPLESYVESVANCLKNVNSELRQFARKEYGNQLVGSTVVALMGDVHRCGFIWAGDSRLYRLRDNKLQQLTQDHCIGNELPLSATSVKTANIITRAIGADEQLNLDMEITEVLSGDVFLLCSDGLDKELSSGEIEMIMQTTPFGDIADTLINEVLNRGARDNVTVVVVAVNDNN
jgi:type VI secretion system protein ImpM